jgi:hypothetical protein
VTSLLGERLQIPATAPLVEKQQSAGGGLAQPGVAERLYPFARGFGVAEWALGKSNPRLLLNRSDLEDK